MRNIFISFLIINALLLSAGQCGLFDKIKNKIDHLRHNSRQKVSNQTHKGMEWLKHHNPHNGFQKFKDQFKKHHDMIKDYLKSHKPKSMPNLPHHQCHHFPQMPFVHKPMYPFMHHPSMNHLIHTPQMNHLHMMSPHMHPFFNMAPPPPGVTEIHFLGHYEKTTPGNLLLSNGQLVPVTNIKSITVEIDFRVDNKLLERMRDQFASYHRKWMMTLGGIFGGFKAMMPFLTHHCKNKKFNHISKFPLLVNKLVRLHEMIVRHEALMRMFNDAQTNQEKISLLEDKLKMIKEKFKKFDKKMEFLNNMNQIKNKKLGKLNKILN